MINSFENITAANLSLDDGIRYEINRFFGRVNFIVAFLQGFLIIGGLSGNLLAILIINKRPLRKTSSAIFITSMAIFDSAVLLVHAANLMRPRRNLFIHCSLTYLTDLLTLCASWMIVIITLERCIAVSSPFLAKRVCTVNSARLSVLFLITSALILSSATFPIMYHPDFSPKRRKCLIRDQFTLFHRLYQFILFYGLPDVLLLTNIYTLHQLFKRRRQWKRASVGSDSKIEMRINDPKSNRKQRQLTIMLVSVSLAFYCFTTPAITMFISEHKLPDRRDMNQLKRRTVFSQLSVLILQLHNATNFIFYSLAGRRFRQETWLTLNQYWWPLKIWFHHDNLKDTDYRKSSNFYLHNFRNSSTSTVQQTLTKDSSKRRSQMI